MVQCVYKLKKRTGSQIYIFIELCYRIQFMNLHKNIKVILIYKVAKEAFIYISTETYWMIFERLSEVDEYESCELCFFIKHFLHDTLVTTFGSNNSVIIYFRVIFTKTKR
jgi:hypothetical protein